MLMELNLRPADVAGKKFYYGKGCDRCNNTGHRGRMGLYEMLVMNDELRDMISANASTDQLRDACDQARHDHPARFRPERDLQRPDHH